MWLNIPISMSSIREPDCAEMRFVIEGAPPGAVRAALSALPGTSVMIKANQEAAVGILIKVVDGVRLSGCTTFSIVTEKP